VTPPVHASFQAVLNCCLREAENWELQPVTEADSREFLRAGLAQFARIALPDRNIEYAVGLKYVSRTLRHRIHFPILQRRTKTGADDAWHEADLESFLRDTLGVAAKKLNADREGQPEALLERIRNSTRNIERFINARAAEVEDLHSSRPQRFIESEQALLLGHPTHPAAKSREGFLDTELARYSPELQGDFPLHFFHVHPDILHTDSAAVGRSAPEIIRNMLGKDTQVPPEFLARCCAKPDWALLPVHPWQANFVQTLPEVQDLFQRGLLEDLGEAGAAFSPTTSIRSVYREGCEFMFKFSLSVKITNSVRVSLTHELDRAVEMARLMQTDFGRQVQHDVPEFGFILDPAYIAVRVDGRVIEPLSCIFREATLVDGDRDISSVASLVQDHPLGGKSRLFRIIEAVAHRENRSRQVVARDWFRAYLGVSVQNLFKLYLKWGLCFEAHAQNCLLELAEGYPVRLLYRDSQGYFHREVAHEDFHAIIPHLGEETQSIAPEELANERGIYYLIINQVFSVINALGVEQLADEKDLLCELSASLDRVASDETRYPSRMPEAIRTLDRLPCKSNLFTQYFNMDELVGDITTQSVYVTVPNPIKAAVEACDR